MKTFQAARYSVSTLLFLLTLLLFAPVSGAETPEEIASRLQKRYDTIHSFTFDFSQDTRGQLSGRPKKGSGQAFFLKSDAADKKSGKMRWNYTAPEKQVLVSDGVTFSMYFASMAQMINSPASALKQDLTYSFFTGSGNLLEDFTVLPPDLTEDSDKQTHVIKLIPREKQSQVASIHLWVTNDSLIRRIEILDHFDTMTVLNFSNLQVNTLDKDNSELMESLFHFTPPEGTEIINQ